MSIDDPIKVNYRESEGLKEIYLPEELSAIKGSRHEIIRDNPLQRPGMPELLQERVIAGPEAMQDVRFTISIQALEAMLEAAKASTTQRAMLHHAGIEVRTWRDGNTGSVYQTLSVIGRGPVPEKSLFAESFINSVKTTK